jgi:hypothetical protein
VHGKYGVYIEFTFLDVIRAIQSWWFWDSELVCGGKDGVINDGRRDEGVSQQHHRMRGLRVDRDHDHQ